MQKDSKDTHHNIKVAIKIRPLLPKEITSNEFETVKVDKNMIVT